MDLYKEILLHALEKEQVTVYFPNLSLSADAIVDGVCYRALKRIKEIVQDDSLSDRECFEKVEEVIYVLEKIGSNGGFRHDF